MSDKSHTLSRKSIIAIVIIIALLLVAGISVGIFLATRDEAQAAESDGQEQVVGNQEDGTTQEQENVESGNTNPENTTQPEQENENAENQNNETTTPEGEQINQNVENNNNQAGNANQNAGTNNNNQTENTEVTTETDVNDIGETTIERVEEVERLVEEKRIVGWIPTEVEVDSTEARLNTSNPELIVTKVAETTSGDNVVFSGQEITYKITVKNNGIKDVNNIEVTDKIPVNTTFVKAENAEEVRNTDGSLAGLRWNIDVPANSETTVEFTVKVNENVEGTISNVAVANGEKSNEEKTAIIKSSKTSVITRLNEETNEYEVVEKAKVGDKITYTITVTNTGDVEGTTTIEDTLTDSVKLLTEGLNVKDSTIVWENQKVPAKESIVLTFEVEVLSVDNGKIKNTAKVGGKDTETNIVDVEAYIVFVENGGTEVADMTGTVDEPISDRTMPTTKRDGYDFLGWYAESEFMNKVEILPEKYLPGTTIYYANWEARTDTKYKVEYYQQNLNDKEYTIVEADTANKEGTTGAEATYEVKDYAGFTYREDLTTPEDKTILGDGSLVIKLYYDRNTNTKYKVEHYLQNVDLKEYTLKDIDNLTGKTGAQTEAKAKDYAGFTVQPFEQEEIKGDGTTVIKIYYTRNTNTAYIVEYYQQNLNDKEYSKVEAVTKSGITGAEAEYEIKDYAGFTYREDLTTPTDKTILGDGSLVIKLYYDRNTNTKYKVEYYQQNLNDEGYTIVEADTVNKEGTTGAKAEYEVKDYAGFTYREDLTTPTDKTILGDGSLVIKLYYDRNKDTSYKVEYYYEKDGEYTTPTKVDSNRVGKTGAEVEVTDTDKTPTISGYIFDENADNILSGTIAGDESLVLKIYFKQQFTVTYLPGDHGTFAEQKTTAIDYGTATPAFRGEITGETGYKFIGWSSEIAETVTKNATYIAQWEPIEYLYKVEYYFEQPDGQFAKNTAMGEIHSALFGEIIDETDIAGYNLKGGLGHEYAYIIQADETEHRNIPELVITENENKNIIKVYYTRKSFKYRVEYYKDALNTTPLKVTERFEEKYLTKMNETIVNEDLGKGWINAEKPQAGYQDGEVQEYIIIQANNENIIKVLYLPKENIPYTIKYFYNNVEDKTLEINGTAKFGQEIEKEVIDKSNEKGGNWSKADNSTTLPYIIQEDNNIINVYYVRPEITVKKESIVDNKETNGIVEVGDYITYIITAKNTGYKEGNIKIADAAPKGTHIVGEITVTSHPNITEKELNEGINLTVPARGEIIIHFSVQVDNVLPGDEVINTPVVNDEEDKENTVTNKVEKTIGVKEKTTEITGSNIVLVLDKSGSMDDPSKEASDKECRSHGNWLHESGRTDCVKKDDGKWYLPKSRMEVAKEVTGDLIDSIELPEVNTNNSSVISVVGFSSDSEVVGSAITNGEVAELKNSVNNMNAKGGTVMSSALATAKNEIDRLSKLKPNNSNIVIFISDGEPDGDRINTIKARAAVLKNVATVYTVAFDKDISILRDTIATDANKYYTTNNADSLSNIIDNVREEIIGGKVEVPIQSVDGRIELKGVYADEEHPIVVTVKNNATASITLKTLPTDANGKVIFENGKYYLDLRKFDADAKISLEYFSK